jgi:dTDP-4-dehydrorhamnose reductase
MKVLLLGSNGQLGSDIVKVFKNSKIELIKYTRKDFDVLKNKINFPEVDYIINCISYHKTDECEDFPDKSFKINSSFVYELSKYCELNDITLFHISTDYVFDGYKSSPYKEEYIPNPLNIYGLSKFSGEKAVQNYLNKYFIFRVSSLFGEAGASGKGGNFVETMIKLAKKNIPLKIISDQYMVPTHTLDIAKVIRFFIENQIDEFGIFHVVSNGSCSWYDFTKEIFTQIGLDYNIEKITYKEYKTKAIRPKYSVLDNRKLSKYYKMPHWKEALNEYLLIKKYIYK